MSNEQNVHLYYMLNHRIRGLLFHYKKNCYFAIGFYFFGKSIQKHPDSICEKFNVVNNEQNVHGYYNYVKPLNERLIILLQIKKKFVVLASIFNSQSINFSIVKIRFIPRFVQFSHICLLYTSPSPRDLSTSRMPSSA